MIVQLRPSSIVNSGYTLKGGGISALQAHQITYWLAFVGYMVSLFHVMRVPVM